MALERLVKKPQLPYVVIVLIVLFAKRYLTPNLGPQGFYFSYWTFLIIILVAYLTTTLISKRIEASKLHLTGFIFLLVSMFVPSSNELVSLILVIFGSTLLASPTVKGETGDD